MITVQRVEFRGHAAICDDHGILSTRTSRALAEQDAIDHARGGHGEDAIRAGTLAVSVNVPTPRRSK